MKSGLHTLLKPSIPEEQLQEVVRTLRPLDELDMNRIAAWETVASLCPEEDNDDDSDDEISNEDEEASHAVSFTTRVAYMSNSQRLEEMQIIEARLQELEKDPWFRGGTRGWF